MVELDRVFCIACGEETPLEKVDSGIGEEEVYKCAHCGAYLGTRKTLEAIIQNPDLSRPGIPPQLRTPEPITKIGDEFHPETSSVAGGLMPQILHESAPASQFPTSAEDEILTPEPTLESSGPKLEAVILAEDSELVSRILKEMIVRKGLSGRVISCKNGFDFVISFLKSRQEKVNPGLIIMDVIMPVLNGISAAVAIRAWEKALNLEPIPILFFTGKKCDETFKRVLQYSRPAMYINKGASESAVSLEARIEKVVNQLLKESF